jgi:hypothetical protein
MRSRALSRRFGLAVLLAVPVAIGRDENQQGGECTSKELSPIARDLRRVMQDKNSPDLMEFPD